MKFRKNLLIEISLLVIVLQLFFLGIKLDKLTAIEATGKPSFKSASNAPMVTDVNIVSIHPNAVMTIQPQLNPLCGYRLLSVLVGNRTSVNGVSIPEHAVPVRQTP